MERRPPIRRSLGQWRPLSRHALCALLAVLGGFVPAVRAGIITIDNFSQPGTATFFVVPSGTNPSKAISQTVSGAIGGQRDVLVNVLGQGKPNSATGLIGHDSSFDVNALQIATNGLAPAMTTVQYSGIETVSPSSLINAHSLSVGAGIGVDLTNGGQNDRFLLQFLFLDASPTVGLNFTINITSPGGKSSTTIMETAANSATAYNYFVPFSDLHGDATPSSVDSITFVFNGTFGSHTPTPNVDYMLQLVGTSSSVPEPASGVLMATAMGIFGAAAARRRKKKQLPGKTGTSRFWWRP